MDKVSIFVAMERRQRKSIRLKGYDYSQSGLYYITICTKNKENVLGEIIESKMKLNKTGQIVQKNWKNIPVNFNKTELDLFVIM